MNTLCTLSLALLLAIGNTYTMHRRFTSKHQERLYCQMMHNAKEAQQLKSERDDLLCKKNALIARQKTDACCLLSVLGISACCLLSLHPPTLEATTVAQYNETIDTCLRDTECLCAIAYGLGPCCEKRKKTRANQVEKLSIEIENIGARIQALTPKAQQMD